MKKLLIFIGIMAFSLFSFSQVTDYVTKKDFQTENQKLTQQINAAKVPGFELRKLYNDQLRKTDSLNLVIQNFDKRIVKIETDLYSFGLNTSDLRNQINNIHQNTRKKIIYLLIIICFVMLVGLALIYIIWSRLNKKLNNLAEDHDKTNEALNLHVKNASEEMAALAENLSKLGSDILAKLEKAKAETERSVTALSSDIRHAALQQDEKIQGIKNESQISKDEMDARITQLSGLINETKTACDKGLKDIASSLSKSDETSKDLSDKLQKLIKKHDDDVASLAKQTSELLLKVDDHKKKDHK
jgi:hypothetical protein